MTTFDPAAIAAKELLSYFGKNTAVRVDHKYGRNELHVIVARTGNVIATIKFDKNLAMEYVDFAKTGDTFIVHPDSLCFVADSIKAMKRFPKPRNMKRSWSPIRLSEKATKDLEIMRATIGGYYMNVDPA